MKKQHMCILQRKEYSDVVGETFQVGKAADNQAGYQAACYWQAIDTLQAYWAKRAKRGREALLGQ